MPSQITQEVLSMIESAVESRPTGIVFELAYQARVAIDRIRIAIKHIEQFEGCTNHMREASLGLLDALDRLESAEHKFHKQSGPLRVHALKPSHITEKLGRVTEILSELAEPSTVGR